MSQTANGVTTQYTLDLNSGLTQVLTENTPGGYGDETYLYGLARLAQVSAESTDYFVADALGSVRQLTDAGANVTLQRSYTPYGEILHTSGTGDTNYAFTGESYDPQTGLTYLRARNYSAGQGRFISKDSWKGNEYQPISYNHWGYANANPIIFTDPSGNWCVAGFSVGPGRSCNEEETQKWAGFYQHQVEIYSMLGQRSNQTLGFIYGFTHEYLDAVSVLGVSSIGHALIDELFGCGVSYNLRNPEVVAGRYYGRAFIFVQAAAEIGFGFAGMAGGGGISLTGGGVIAGVPVATLSLAVAGHGALMFGHLAIKEMADPLPNIYFSDSGNVSRGGESTNPNVPEKPIRQLPPEAQDTISRIKSGGPYPYSKDGTIFHNAEGKLPINPEGYYREYTVETPGAANRGTQRIISGDLGDVFYYTPDHYQSFFRIIFGS